MNRPTIGGQFIVGRGFCSLEREGQAILSVRLGQMTLGNFTSGQVTTFEGDVVKANTSQLDGGHLV